MSYESATHCRCCGSGELALGLDLGRQPLANSYTTSPVDLPAYPLQLLVCQECFHNQLSVIVDPERMFRHYLYVSGTSRTLREHFAGLAREAMQWVGLPSPRVLDLACNDGTLLDAFRTEGCQVAGVDPAHNLVQLARDRGFEVVEGFWPRARGEFQGTFDLITAANVLAHVASPRDFLAAALDVLSGPGLMVVEVPYCREMVLRCEWDTIYHEHLSYFLVSPLLRLLDGLGAVVSQARLLPIHGGSLRLAFRRGAGPHCREALELAGRERQDGLLDMPTYETFARRVEANCQGLRDLIDPLAAAGRRVIGYGASAKGNTLLNHCPLPLAYIVDDNPLKHGYFTPGRNVPIQAPQSALEEAPGLHVLLLAWNFAREITGNWRNWRAGQGDRVIHYVPAVRAHAVEGPHGCPDC